MKFKIFTEGGSDVGLGHISRCTSLYDEIIKQGNNVEFHINGEIDNIRFLDGYNVIKCNWLDVKYIKNNISIDDYCIVDSYLADRKIYDAIAESSKITLYIDDTNRIEYPKGIVVNPSLSTDSIIYNKNEDIKYLLGSDYIILRTPFIGIHRDKNEIDSHKVLIVMGGADMKNITPTIIEKICNTNKNISFDIVVGSTFTNIKYIEDIIKENVTLRYNLDAEEIKDLMIQSDFAITAAGQTTYELLATQTPFIPIKIANNQINNINGLKKYNSCMDYLDIEDDNWIIKLIEEFEKISDYSYRIRFNELFCNLVDGFGSRRIIDYFLEN